MSESEKGCICSDPTVRENIPCPVHHPEPPPKSGGMREIAGQLSAEMGRLAALAFMEGYTMGAEDASSGRRWDKTRAKDRLENVIGRWGAE